MLERRGLVRLFDQRVLELAIEMLGADPTLNLSVNVSPRSLNDPEWFDAFIACTAAARARPRALIVEITETATIESPARIAKLLGRIKDQGARVAIDDFGAGHTSLRHLRAFPIDILKIDGAFTQNLRRSTDDTSMSARWSSSPAISASRRWPSGSMTSCRRACCATGASPICRAISWDGRKQVRRAAGRTAPAGGRLRRATNPRLGWAGVRGRSSQAVASTPAQFVTLD